uniref:Uncharacterized protein n=1 Tax=Sphaerodactylus townsendi TaxID=933632 RepID=A0ACB8EM64_9SAUR
MSLLLTEIPNDISGFHMMLLFHSPFAVVATLTSEPCSVLQSSSRCPSPVLLNKVLRLIRAETFLIPSNCQIPGAFLKLFQENSQIFALLSRMWFYPLKNPTD